MHGRSYLHSYMNKRKKEVYNDEIELQQLAQYEDT